MDDVVSMDVVDPLQDLLHEDAAGQLAEDELVLYDPVKELPAANAEHRQRGKDYADDDTIEKTLSA